MKAMRNGRLGAALAWCLRSKVRSCIHTIAEDNEQKWLLWGDQWGYRGHVHTNAFSVVILYMTKKLDSDRLRAVLFKCNTSADYTSQCNGIWRLNFCLPQISGWSSYGSPFKRFTDQVHRGSPWTRVQRNNVYFYSSLKIFESHRVYFRWTSTQLRMFA